MDATLLPALLIGLIAGIIAAYVGIGGGVILTPMLLLFFAWRAYPETQLMQHIFATNMAFMIFASSLTAWRYHRHYHLRLLRLSGLFLGAASGALAASFIATVLPGEVLRNIFGVVLLLSSLRFLFGRKLIPSPGSDRHVPFWLAFLGGGIGGGLAPLAGIGGGLVFVPLISGLFAIPLKQTPGYSHATIVITAAISLLGYISASPGSDFPDSHLGFVNLPVAGLMIIGAIPGIRLGTLLNQRSSSRQVTLIIGTFIFAMAIYITFFA
jgi:uncharacterized membrane protein YfcA